MKSPKASTFFTGKKKDVAFHDGSIRLYNQFSFKEDLQ